MTKNRSTAEPAQKMDGSAGQPGRLRLLAASLLLVLLVAEVGLRLIGIEPPYPIYYPGEIAPGTSPHRDPRIGWKMLANEEIREHSPEYDVVYRASRQGFRTPWDIEAPYVGETIVFLGDSYTFGTGVADDQTFVSRIDHALADSRCVNLGIGAFGLDQMWLVLRHHGLPLQPRLVVLTFIRNDLDRSLSKYRENGVWFEKPTFRLDGERLVEMEDDHIPGWWHGVFLRRFGLGRLWSRVEYSLSRRWPIGYRWRLNRAIFAALARETEAAGADLLVVHVPINRLHPAPGISRELSALGIEVLDLADHLPAASEKLYFPDNRHLTPEGHAFVAEVLLERLQASHRGPTDRLDRPPPAAGIASPAHE